jgi:hypothetical protein
MKAIKKIGIKKDVAHRAQQQQIIKPTGAQAIVGHLRHFLADIHNSPVLTGQPGCQCLDALELCDKIRTEYRAKVRELLVKSPHAIPHWHVTETTQRTLSKDTARVFDALSRKDDTLTPEAFIEACTANLGSVRKLLAERNPQWSPDQVEHTLNRALTDLISYDTVTRLSRSKDRQLNLSL